jgi:antirestriction protein ArdC
MISPVHHIFNHRILQKLSKDIVPWRQPWPTHATNLFTGQPYGGINALILNLEPSRSPFWLTFREALKLGGHVNPAAPPVPVYLTRYSDTDGRCRELPRYVNTFNLDHIFDIEAPSVQQSPPADPLEAAKALAEQAGLGPVVHRHTPPCYLHGIDQIWMPTVDSYPTPETYYHELFGQLARATAHPTRLNRTAFQQDAGTEHLTAEIAACFLSNQTGIMARVHFEDEPAMVAGWHRAFQRDPSLVIRAAARAQDAAYFVSHHIAQQLQPLPPTITLHV